MKILVIGATGGTGKEIVKQAISAGHTVTALVRDEARARPQLGGANLLQGDVQDVASLRRAATGQEAVVYALGCPMSGPFKKVTLFSNSTRALLAAMEAEGVRRLVCITGNGAGDSRGHGSFLYVWLFQPLLLRGIYVDKDRQEELIRASRLDWIIVRPGMLLNGPAVGGTETFAIPDHFPGGAITRADTAAFVLAQLSSDEWLRKTPLIVRAKAAARRAN